MIVSEINETGVYSIMLDETMDVSKVVQVSFCVRYVDQKGVVQERLLEMLGISSTKSAELLKRVVDSLDKHGLKMDGIVSQSYDGASTMSGEVTGLQTRVRELVPHAVFVWCGGHRLNLVVEDVCKRLPFLEHVFMVLGAIPAWFSRSGPRNKKFLELAQEQHEQDTMATGGFLNSLHSFQTLSVTRWFSRDKNIKSSKKNMVALIGTLDYFEEDGVGLTALVCSFRFQCPLHLAAPFFEIVNTVSRQMQMIKSDIGTIGENIKNLISLFKEWRDKKENGADPFPSKFDAVYKDVIEWCTELEIEIELGRCRSRPSQFNDAESTPGLQQTLAERQAFSNETVKQRVYRTMWTPLIEAILQSVGERFSEESLALGCGVNAFVSLSDNSKANTDCFMDDFLSMYPQLNNMKDEILSEWNLCRLTILAADQEEYGKLEGNACAILLFMHGRGNGGGNAGSLPIKDLYPNFSWHWLLQLQLHSLLQRMNEAFQS
jgi:hypothetical protein